MNKRLNYIDYNFDNFKVNKRNIFKTNKNLNEISKGTK